MTDATDKPGLTLQDFDNDLLKTVPLLGGYWPVKDILLQLMEESGELAQAVRKKTKKDVIEEAGDALFAILCFIHSEGIMEDVVDYRYYKNEASVKNLQWREPLQVAQPAIPQEKYSTWIIWGQSEKTAPTRYDFDTPEELIAFLEGADQANGYLDYESFETADEADEAYNKEQEDDDTE